MWCTSFWYYATLLPNYKMMRPSVNVKSKMLSPLLFLVTLSRPRGIVCDYKYMGVGLITGCIGQSEFLVTIQTNSVSHIVQFTMARTVFPVCSPFTSPLVPAFNSGRSFFWVPVLQPQQLLTCSELTNSIMLAPLHTFKFSRFWSWIGTVFTCHCYFLQWSVTRYVLQCIVLYRLVSTLCKSKAGQLENIVSLVLLTARILAMIRLSLLGLIVDQRETSLSYMRYHGNTTRYRAMGICRVFMIPVLCRHVTLVFIHVACMK
jgi:hypothetical protein